VIDWLRSEDIQARAWAIPDQFAALFDLVFTNRHWSRECFYRSCLASAGAVVAVLGLKISFGSWSSDPASARVGGFILAWAALLWIMLLLGTVALSRWWRLLFSVVFLALALGPGILDQLQDQLVLTGPLATVDAQGASIAGMVLMVATLLNFVPDYTSLLETRWAIRWMGRAGRLGRLIAVDALVTALISLFSIGLFYAVVVAPSMGRSFAIGELLVSVFWPPYAPLTAENSEAFGLVLLSISFYSAFFTSAWLWLYALGTILARLLVRMNSGIGFLLRVTDVERQPFRSMGFVSVLIVSGLFLLGLPFVLL
jgi:hypothetical protein